MAKKFIFSRLLFRNGNKKSSSNTAHNEPAKSTKKSAFYSTKSSSSTSSSTLNKSNNYNKDQVTDSILKVSKQKQQHLLSLLKYSNSDMHVDDELNDIPPDQQAIYLLRLYLATVQKLKRYQPNSMEKQKAVYGLLSCLVIQQELDRFDAEFEPVGRKPRKTRYISTLLDTPVESITPFHHPVLEANKRKPFVETFHVIIPSSPSESSFSSSTVSLASTASSSTLTSSFSTASSSSSSSSPSPSIKSIGTIFHSSSSFPPYKRRINNRPSWVFSSSPFTTTNNNYPLLNSSNSSSNSSDNNSNNNSNSTSNSISLSPPPILPRASSFILTPHLHLVNANANDGDGVKHLVSHHHHHRYHLWTSRSDSHLHASFSNQHPQTDMKHLTYIDTPTSAIAATAAAATEDEDDIPLAVLRTRKVVVDRPVESNSVHFCC